MAKKKVYIEALGLVEGHFSGIGQYILGILRGLDEIVNEEILDGNEVPDIRIIIPYNTRRKFKKFKFKHLRPKLFPLPFRYMAFLWHRGKMPPLDLWCGRGYYLFTRFATMPLWFSKSAVIIYDISFETHRQYSDEGNAIFLSRATRKSVKQARTIFTISKNAKKEIEDVFRVPSKDIIVATPAADQRFFYRRSEKEIKKAKEKYGIKGEYILALSNLEPRKNLDTLVDAYCALPKNYRKSTSLLLVGVSGWKTDALFEKIIDRVNDGYNIIRPSKYVNDKDKPAVISGAKMLIYPSHYEGFGMPPLEALACGVPVITANNSSLPEVVNGVGTMLEATDTAGLQKEIERYLGNIEAITKRTVTEGPRQAESFSWKASARIYYDHMKESL